MDLAIGAARWVVERALATVTDGLLESLTASSKLGANARALKTELLFAQAILENAPGRDVRSQALGQLLLELRDVAYDADDVVDELEYFRIQDELEGTHETTDTGLVGGLVHNARHTAGAVASKLKFPSCSCASSSSHDDEEEEEAKKGCLWSGGCQRTRGMRSPPPTTHDGDQDIAGGCMSKLVSSSRNTAHVVGKHLACHTSVHGAWPCKSRQKEHTVDAPKLKFDRVEISKRMKDIAQQLQHLCAKVEPFSFSRARPHDNAFERTKTTPQIIEPKLYGRDDKKSNVVYKITRDKCCANDLTVLSIVGPGGIGKTTFTQHIYEEVKSHFDVPIWTCVSLDFSASRLIQEIVEKIPQVKEENKIASAEERITTRLQSKKFLLVLDDMWKYQENGWRSLLAPLKKGGTKGSIVIVTTRFPHVAELVATTRDCLVNLERLEHEDCKLFFQACVFGDQQAWEGHGGDDLSKVGEDIVKRLKGSPLAVKTVSRLLRNKLTLDYWKRVLESAEWKLQTGDDDIMPALNLSYNYLPFHLQQCFSYCGLFPQDYEFDSKELIHLWIGLGLLGTSHQNKRIEDIGEDYLTELVNFGFFQENLKGDYLIHDLLHELAVNVSSYECLSILGSNMRSLQIPASIRHLSIVIDNEDVKDKTTYEYCKRGLIELCGRLKAENLRTLMLFGEHNASFSKILRDLCGSAKALRVLFLTGVSYNLEDLLPNFSKLVHLRFLRIMGCIYHRTTVPVYVSRFYHLLVLHLENCNTTSASMRDMSSLVKIRHILVEDANVHSEITEVGKLRSLQELRTFGVKKEANGFELKQLGELLELRGSLRIYNLEKVEEREEADEAKLVHMNHLNRLELQWKWGIDQSSKDPKKEEYILECLKPHSNVQAVCIKGHGGTIYPSWLGADLYFDQLESLQIDNVAWKHLPPIGELLMDNEGGEGRPSSISNQNFLHLKRIELISIERLKKWCGNGTAQLFPNLEVLTVGHCPELIELPFSRATNCPAEEEKLVNMFPKLREINISNCGKLSSLPPIPWTNSMSVAKISKVGTCIQRLSYRNNQRSKYIEVEMGKDADDSKVWSMLAFNNLRAIERLEITTCPPVALDHLKMLSCLKSLSFRECINVLQPIECETNSCYYEFPVEDLRFGRCDATGKELTRFLSYFPKLSTFQLWNCKRVTWLGVAEKQTTAAPTPLPSVLDEKTEDAQIGPGKAEQEIESPDDGLLLLPPQIQELEIIGCPDLRLCSGSLDEGTAAVRGLQGLASLRWLQVFRCPEFLSSSSSSSPYCPFPTSLQELFLRGTKGMFTLAALSNLTQLTINDCGDLRGEILWPLLALGHLTELRIYECPNLLVASEHIAGSKYGSMNAQTSLDGNDFLRSCTLQVLSTDGKSGILAVPICARLSSSLTKLGFGWNDDMERFTKEQEEALQNLNSLQELQILDCEKLRSLPTGLSGLHNLKRLEIEGCNAIHLWPKDGLPPSLTELRIAYCPAMRSLPKGDLPSTLWALDVSDSDNEELKSQCRKLRGTIPIIEA